MPGVPQIRELERAFRAAGSDAAELIRVHERALFLRAYPSTPAVARRAERILDRVASRVGKLSDRSAFEQPDVSGIACTSFTTVFSYEVARRLAERNRGLRIDWEALDEPDRFGPVARRFIPLLEEDWPVEAHAPWRQWLRGAVPRGQDELRWLLDRVAALPLDDRARSDLFDSLRLPLYWDLGDGPRTRTRLRLRRPLYCHTGPLLGRRDVSLRDAFHQPPLSVERVPHREAARILDLMLDTSAMRYRELYGFTHPDPTRLFRADCGRGVEIFFGGIPREWRLPLRAYHSGMFFKNGVPAGYVELLSLFDRAEIGFNLYYTFREGESAWLYARMLQLFHQVLGVNTFVVDPYQIGHQNDEALDSGAFWFYRKLGFRPVEPGVVKLAEQEERRLARSPTHRSSRPILKKLSTGYVVFEGPAARPGEWDRFQARNLGLAVQRETARRHGGDPERMQHWAAGRLSRALSTPVSGPLVDVLSLIPDLSRWTSSEKSAAAAILRAKNGAEETRYLHLAQKHARLREALRKLGRSTPTATA